MNMREEIREAMTEYGEGDRPEAVVATFYFGADSPVFAGHFPNRAVLPGVFHLEMMLAALAATKGVRREVALIRKAKMTSEVGPDMQLDVEVMVEGEAAGCLLRGKVSHGSTQAASIVAELKPLKLQ